MAAGGHFARAKKLPRLPKVFHPFKQKKKKCKNPTKFSWNIDKKALRSMYTRQVSQSLNRPLLPILWSELTTFLVNLSCLKGVMSFHSLFWQLWKICIFLKIYEENRFQPSKQLNSSTLTIEKLDRIYSSSNLSLLLTLQNGTKKLGLQCNSAHKYLIQIQ